MAATSTGCAGAVELLGPGVGAATGAGMAGLVDPWGAGALDGAGAPEETGAAAVLEA